MPRVPRIHRHLSFTRNFELSRNFRSFLLQSVHYTYGRMARPLKKRRHVFGLEKLIGTSSSSSKRARDDDSCKSSQSQQQQEPPNKKQKAVIWSATVPDNRVGKRTVNRMDTPKKPKAIPTTSAVESSLSTKENSGKVHLQIDGNRAIAIKSSRLAVDVAKCRASQAELSLERAKRREHQAKAALLEAASERFLAEQEKDAASHGVKKAADYLLNLLQGGGEDVSANANTIACIGTADKGLSLLGVHACQAKNIDANAGKHVLSSSLVTAEADLSDLPLPLKKEDPQSKSPPAAALKEQPSLKTVKDKRMVCPTTKQMGSYSGQGRTNKETGEFERHGEGCMSLDGCDFVYRGEFCANMRHGHGCELNAKGHGYSGEWRNDTKYGHGSICDVACISGGRFENDQRVGPHAYHFADGRACLKNHVNNRELCGPSLAFSACRRYVRVCNDGDVEVVKQGMLSFYLDQMTMNADDGTILRATVPSPRKF